MGPSGGNTELSISWPRRRERRDACYNSSLTQPHGPIWSLTSFVLVRAEMSGQPPVSPMVASPESPSRFVRVEYLAFQDVAEHREYRVRVCVPDGSTEFRLRIANAAFGAGRLRLQDGPDVCYQKVLRAVSAGEMASSDVIVIDDVDLASYREAHTHVPKRRSWTPAPSPPPATEPSKPTRIRARPPMPAPLATPGIKRALEQGQRVTHAVFGVGVTTSTSDGHIVVWFDEGGSKRFVTSMLEVDVLSAPHTWETGPRGHNRPCPTP